MAVHDKAFIVSKFWAGIFAVIIASCVVGGWAYAFNTNASFAVLQGQVKEIREARLPERITALENQVKASNEGMVRVERVQYRLEDKLDKALERR